MFFCNEGTSKIVLYLKLAWATHSLVIDSGTSSWSSLGNCTAGNLPPYMNFSWWANKARFTLKLVFRMAHHSIWSLPVPLGDQPCPVSPIHTHLLKSMFVSSRGPTCKCSNRKHFYLTVESMLSLPTKLKTRFLQSYLKCLPKGWSGKWLDASD